MDKLLATVPKNAVEEIRISLTTYKARELLDIRTYFRQQRGSSEAQNHAAELKLRAERRLGELLRETVQAGNPQLSQGETIGRLPEGISRMQSHRWQRAANLPEPAFEAYVSDTRPEKELTSSDVQRLAREHLRAQQREAWQQRPSATAVVLVPCKSRGSPIWSAA